MSKHVKSGIGRKPPPFDGDNLNATGGLCESPSYIRGLGKSPSASSQPCVRRCPYSLDTHRQGRMEHARGGPHRVQGYLAHKKPPFPSIPKEGLCLGPYDSPRGGAFSYE